MRVSLSKWQHGMSRKGKNHKIELSHVSDFIAQAQARVLGLLYTSHIRTFI